MRRSLEGLRSASKKIGILHVRGFACKLWVEGFGFVLVDGVGPWVLLGTSALI